MFALAEVPNIDIVLWTKIVFLDDIEVFASFIDCRGIKVTSNKPRKIKFFKQITGKNI